MHWKFGNGFRFLVLTFLFAGLIPVIRAEEPPKEKPNSISRFVKVTASASKPDADGKQELTVTLKIDPKCYVYANPVGWEDLQGTELTMAVKVDGKPVQANIEYPPGLDKKVFSLGSMKIYRGAVIVRATIRQSPGDTKPLEVNLNLHGQLLEGVY